MNEPIELGQTVTYVKQNVHTKELITGTGVVVAFALDAAKRRTAHLDIGGQGINVELGCLNPSPEFIEQYGEHVAKIDALAAEGNEASRRIAMEYQAKVDALNDEFLGKAVDFQAPTSVVQSSIGAQTE